MSSKNKGSGGGRATKPLHALIVLMALGLVFFVMRNRSRKTPGDNPGEQEISLLPDDTGLRTSEPEGFDAKGYQATLDRRRALLAAKDLLGLKTLNLKSENDVLTIPFSFKPRKVWCQGGDIDTMKYASDNPAAMDILITIEPFSEQGKKDVLRTSVANLYKGLDNTFKVKAGEGTLSYGLYICSDSKKRGSCKDKALKSHADISQEMANAADSPAKVDYIFYFQHLLLGKDKLEVYRTNDFSDAFRTSVEAYLDSQRAVHRSEVRKAWKISEISRSESADIRDGRIVLSLPYNDPRCLDGGAP